MSSEPSSGTGGNREFNNSMLKTKNLYQEYRNVKCRHRYLYWQITQSLSIADKDICFFLTNKIRQYSDIPVKVKSMSSKFGCNGPKLGCIKSALPASRARGVK